MGIKERQERDREAIRRSILDAARELFVTEGYQNVSIRKIAERIEYSPAALYGYFPSKDDIFFALAEEGFRLMHDPERFARLGQLPPEARLRTMFWHFYEFSVEQPQYFALMFLDRSVPRISQVYERFAFAREMKQRLITEVQGCIDEGALPRGLDPLVAFRLIITGLLGAAAMRLSDRLSPGENPEDLARDLLNVAIAGLQSNKPLNSQPISCTALPDWQPPPHRTPQS
jgi:AcrR family transcriptional regulator